MLTRRIEEAALNAWPALQQMLYDGWLLRFAEGFTKRANSVTPLYDAHIELWQKIAFCEGCYRERGLPPIFRLTPFAQPGNLDRALAERGYALRDPTWTLWLDLSTWRGPPSSMTPYEERLEPWLALYARFSGVGTDGAAWAQQRVHGQLLSMIPGRRLLASVADGECTVGCGLGVLQDDLFGLFDIIIDPARRCRGHGTRLVAGMLSWAARQGARLAYLQVTEANTAAQRLYRRLGFAALYRYWYRIAEPLRCIQRSS
ncbi:MAG: GNAT family N-acetyltransferase [Chloroflexi bacterium]|nr:GNAT family N-acetyltransferase [Chloroflexota bacterium]